MKGCVIVNGYFYNHAVLSQTARLKEEFLRKGIVLDEIKSNSFDYGVKGDEPFADIGEYDFVVYLNKDRFLAEILEKLGYRLFNRCESIVRCDDKALTYLSLLGSGLKVPETLPSPLMYSVSDDVDFLRRVEKKIPYPIIVKTDFGSMGKGVFKADNFDELKDLYERFRMQPHIYQKAIGVLGEDIRVIVIGGRATACMRRKNENDYRSNVELGGKTFPLPITPEIREVAERAAKVLHLDYCGVDILTGDDGYYVCEVNSNAFFEGIEKATGVNVAGAYVDHVLSVIKNGR
ncbi:MAG: RimK family alpha-L-glutamate ligase [Clostridia bacterium]|nr:RimK family alpha-L-glutamate ligase [Clostridia bacterium]